MRLGLVGLPMSGKTTLFNALTGASRPTSAGAPGKLDVQVAVVDVPDLRLDHLTDLFNPQKKVAAKITFADIAGLSKGISEGGLSGQFRTELSQMDGYLQVIRVFEDPSVPHLEETIDPQRDLETLDTEFLLSDMVVVENRMTRLQEEMDRGKDRDRNAKELAFFETLKNALEEATPLRDLNLSQDDIRALRGYGFLTLKPRIIVLNLGDQPAGATILDDIGDAEVLSINAQIEAEIAELDPEEAQIFLEEYQLDEPARDRIIHQSYTMMHVQTFFTVGDDEVRAWPHPIGATAQEAAGEIHSDLERGFIRAEIVPWDVLLEHGGLSEVRKVGKLQVEGKDYIMKDGDVMSVRFNV